MNVQTNETADTIRDRVLSAFSGPRSDWRTAGGVARDTGIPEPAVVEFLTGHPELFVESPITLGGIPVFGLRERVESDDD